MGFQHWWLINHVRPKRFINPGGPPVFKLQKIGRRRRLINNGVLINPDLTLYIMVYTMVYIMGKMVYIMVYCGKIIGLASKS
jgi:hypothetical protein